MKKRPLFQRLFSGIVATALAATICFGDGVFKDIFASAVGEAQTVNVNFYDNGDPAVYDAHENGMRYFVLGAIVDKDAGPKIAATAAYEDQIIAWDCKEITPQTNAASTVVFEKFYKNDMDHTKFDRNQPEVQFDAAKHKFITRVYRYWVTRDAYGSTQPSENPHSTKGVEPTNLIAPEGTFQAMVPYEGFFTYHEQSSDSFPDYIPSNKQSGNTTTVEFNKHENEYYVDVNFAKPTTITSDEYYYVLVEVEHQNHDTSYFCSQLVADNTNKVELVIQDKDNKNLKKSDNTVDQYTGNEPSTKVRLFKASKECNVGNLLAGENCSEVKAGDFAKTQKVEFKEQVKDTSSEVTTKYYEVINLLKSDENDNYTYEDILGSGISFGITADRFALKGHMQTNLAVNYFRDTKDGQNFECDLSEPSAGDHFIAYFAELSDPTDIADDADGTITIGNTKRPGVMHVDLNNINRVKFTGGGDQWFGSLSESSMPAADIKGNVVDPTIQQMQAMSNLLASKNANITPYRDGTRYVIDSRDYPDDATIYVDADALVKDNRNCDVEFFKKENQTIVMNFKNTKNVHVNSYNVNYVKDGELKTIGSATSDGLEVDEQVMRKIVWNFNSCYNTDEEFKANNDPCVEISNTAGTFLIPNPTTITHMTGTSSGWIMTAGYFENTSGEWHFPYHKMKPYEAPKSTSVVVSKRAITGDKELKGATIQIVDKVTGKNIGDTIWESLVNVNEGVKALTADIGGLKDVKYGIQWTSGDTEKTIVLRDGSYTLKEFGDEFVSGGATYSVVTSSVDFEIMNGQITKTPKAVTEADGGSIKYDDKTNTIIIRDAQKGGPTKTYVNINKTDITGQKELNGATLTVYKKDGETLTKVDDENNPWTSKDGKQLSLALEDGTYVLRETGGEVTDADGKTYKVMSTDVEFTVADGTVTSTAAKSSFTELAGKEGAVLENDAASGEYTLTICDAANTTPVKINKTNITGSTELSGAKLAVYNYDSTKTDGKGTQVGETWTSAPDKTMDLVLEDGTYVLEETGDNITDADGKTYKVIPSTVKFTVKNGTVTSTDTVARPGEVDKANGGAVLSCTNLTICDAANTTPVTINKTDVTGDKELEGAAITVKQGDKVVKTWTSKAGETMDLVLEDGTYTLEETGDNITDADGKTYKVIPSAVTFTVKNGTVTSTGAKTKFDDVDKTNGGTVLNGTNLTICDAANTTPVKINKTDVTGDKELEGATLTVKQGDKVVKEWTSKAGETMDLVLEDGTYTLEETGDEITDAQGNKYKVIGSTVTFTVKNGAVTSTGAKTTFDDVDKTNGGVVVKGTELTICDAEVPKANVKINKTDVTGDKELAGATLTVKQGDKVIKTWTSKANETMDLVLEDGTYTLEESGDNITDAQGNTYKVLGSTVTFTVTNGVATATGAKTSYRDIDEKVGGVVETAENTFVICDAVVPKNTVTINKTDVTGEKELTGATLTVKKGDKVVKTWESKPNETMDLELEDGTYTLEETGDNITDADGNTYKVIGSTITFKVENGVVTSTGAKTTFDDVDETTGGVVVKNNTITVSDAVKTVKVTIAKTDITGQQEVKGAKLILKDSKGTQVGETWVSGGTNGSKFEVSLAPGKYTLTEAADSVVTDNDGNEYQVITSTYEFEVGTDGKVKDSKAVDTNEGSIAAGNNNTITVVDALAPVKTPVHFNKTDITGQKELAGATLTVYAKGTNGELTKVEDAYNPWESKIGAQLTLQLGDGDYVLKETGTQVTDADGKSYNVLATDVEFTVANGVVTSTGAKTKFEDVTTEGAVLNKDNSGEYVLTVCDAVKTYKVTIAKTDVTGQQEVKGAKLILKDSKGTQIGETWVSGGTNGSKFEVSLEPGKYTLTEAADSVVTDNDGNEYQVITSTYEFEVGTDGKVKDSKKVDSNEGTISAGDNNTITVVDAIKPAKPTFVHINKTDITGQKELAGATLTVYAKGADGNLTKVDDANNPWVSKADAQLTLALADGDYVLKETGTQVTDAQGKTYKVLSSDVEFTVAKGVVTSTGAKTKFEDVTTEGAVLAKDDATGEYTLTVCDAANKTSVTLNKTDITGDKELAGAKLTIKQGETVVGEWESVIGQTKTFELEDGTYTLEETGTKITDNDGNTYDVIPSAVTFTVKNGTVTSADAKTSFDDVDAKGGAVLSRTTLTICDAKTVVPKTPVKINKTDVTGEKELTGATLTVKQGDKVIDSWTSKPNETMELELEDGDYTLTETGDEVTDADGKTYKVIGSEVKFTVKDGKVTSTGAKTTFDDVDKTTGGVVVKNNDITICDAANTTKVIINKTDVTGEKELTGAKLTVKQGDKTIKEWTSKPNETMDLDLEDGEYTLTETGDEITDSDGKTYKVIDSEVKFTVKNGTVTSTGAKTTFDDVDKTTGGVVVKDTHLTISDAAKVTPVVLNKTDITGDKELKGATLTIKDSKGKEIASWTSEIGKTKTVELEDGDYSLTESGDEVTDSDGKTYKVLGTVLDFTVKDGTVTATGAKKTFNKDASDGYVVLQDNKLTVCDVMELTKVKLNKTDITGDKELAGATLTIKDSKDKEVASWTSVIGKTYEVELEDGEYTLTETGTNVTDADGEKYDVMTSSVKFTVSGGKVTSQTVRTDFDETAQTGFVVLKNKTELTVCDVKKNQSNVSSSGSGQSEPSMSVSSPQVSSQPSGSVSSDQSQQSNPSQSVSTPSQSVSTPSPSVSTPQSSSVKSVTSSDGSSVSTNGTSPSGTTKSTDGTASTTAKSSTNGQPPVTTTTGNGGGNPPQTGHSGSSVTVAALLAAVAVLAVLKKKNDE